MQNIQNKKQNCASFLSFHEFSMTVFSFIECNSFRGLNVVRNYLNKNKVEATRGHQLQILYRIVMGTLEHNVKNT